MSREESARAGAQAAVGDDQVVDVAVVMPRGSTASGVLGAAVGVAGGAGSNTTAWGVAGGMIGQRVNAASRGSFPSLVLALSASRLYVLGRRSTGLVGGWKKMTPVGQIELKNLSVDRRRHGTVRIIELKDRSTGSTLEVEAQNVGGLGLESLLEKIEDGSVDT